MKKWLVEYWKEWNDQSTDFYLIVEARNVEEAELIARHQQPRGKHFHAEEATKIQIEIYDK